MVLTTFRRASESDLEWLGPGVPGVTTGTSVRDYSSHAFWPCIGKRDLS